MNWLCLFNMHNWVYGPAKVDNINGKHAKYMVQDRVCSCCKKASRVMLDN